MIYGKRNQSYILLRTNHIFYGRPRRSFLITRVHIVLSSQRGIFQNWATLTILKDGNRLRDDASVRLFALMADVTSRVAQCHDNATRYRWKKIPTSFFCSGRATEGKRGGTSDKKIWWNSYAASSTTVAKKNSVLLSLEMTTTGSRGVSSSSSLLPDAVFVGSSIPGATRVAAPSAVSANLATEYPLRDLSQKPLEKPLHLSCTSLFIRHPPALIQVAYLSCTKRWQHLQDPEWQSVAVSFLRRRSQTNL